MTVRNLFVAAAGAILVASLPGGAAFAAEASGPVVRTVRFADLNPSEPADAQRLYQRLKSAAEAVCRTHEGADLARKQDFAACRSAALDGAVAALDAPLVTAVHRGQPVTAVAAVRTPDL